MKVGFMSLAGNWLALMKQHPYVWLRVSLSLLVCCYGKHNVYELKKLISSVATESEFSAETKRCRWARPCGTTKYLPPS
jgi:heme exporter protein D